eukprot:CAMPEP_0118856662 /NCGR_PEP_ID=MMETSP1163-20130328/4051_1 /TAXON_ID=124430 /ORGANISM="Phaeomonas parva, Strain CCMP2877" /LENGTH=34 /DNA_ID= /DNA_START= /DNA_END= /DNA_ORIENTATION=
MARCVKPKPNPKPKATDSPNLALARVPRTILRRA